MAYTVYTCHRLQLPRKGQTHEDHEEGQRDEDRNCCRHCRLPHINSPIEMSVKWTKGAYAPIFYPFSYQESRPRLRALRTQRMASRSEVSAISRMEPDGRRTKIIHFALFISILPIERQLEIAKEGLSPLIY